MNVPKKFVEHLKQIAKDGFGRSTVLQYLKEQTFDRIEGLTMMLTLVDEVAKPWFVACSHAMYFVPALYAALGIGTGIPLWIIPPALVLRSGWLWAHMDDEDRTHRSSRMFLRGIAWTLLAGLTYTTVGTPWSMLYVCGAFIAQNVSNFLYHLLKEGLYDYRLEKQYRETVHGMVSGTEFYPRTIDTGGSDCIIEQ